MKTIFTVCLSLFCSLSLAQNWDRVYAFPTKTLWAITFTDSAIGYVSGDSGLIAKTFDGGENWTALQTGTDAKLFGLTFLNDSVGFAVGDTGTILKSSDRGLTWQKISNAFRTRNFNKISFPDPQTGFIFGDSGTVLKSVDGGSTWVNSSNPGVGGIPVETQFRCATFLNSQIGFAAGAVFGGANARTVLVRTKDGGNSWDTLNHGFPNNRIGLWGLSFPKPTVGFASGVFGVVLKTLDTGRVWVRIRQMGGNYARAMHFVDENQGWLVGSMQGGLSFADGAIKSTVDGGFTWTEEFWPGIDIDWPVQTTARLTAIAPKREGDGVRLFAVGSYGVILKNTGITSSSGKRRQSNESISMFPNPGAQKVWIRCSQKKNIESVSLIDSKGQPIELPLSALRSESPDLHFLSVADLPSGLYLINLKIEGRIYQRKFVRY